MPHERSTFGCWSCRVRKKKCDENYPTCTACYSRSITCHGYGPKPEWMDGGEKEKKVVDELKRGIKENHKQRKALSPPISPPTSSGGGGGFQSGTSLSPESMTTSDLTYYCPPLTAVQPCPQPLNPAEIEFRQQHSSLAKLHGLDAAELSQKYKENESTLLMNYLDNVFPLQFNCYVPPIVELGRGWLLALLTRTKALYHAAMALSAFYMHSVLLKGGRVQCLNGHWESIKMHHALAFQELQKQIAASNHGQREGSLKERIEILACIIQLISFELLRGGTDSWQIHLQAASKLVPALAAEWKTLESSTKSISELYIEQLDRGDAPPEVNQVACDFLVGTFIWFDIIASASTRSKPFLANNFEYLGNIELDKVMGCENWVMILIAQISFLEEWKQSMQKVGRLSMVELSARGSEIVSALNSGLASQTIFPSAPENANCPTRQTSLITRIFAHSALTYLHTVVSGAHPDLPEIKASVSMTITALSNLPTLRLLQNLVWPFCVAGCMTGRAHEMSLRNLVVAAANETQCPGNYWKAFEIIKECWRLRETQEGGANGVDWISAMESLGFQVLLV